MTKFKGVMSLQNWKKKTILSGKPIGGLKEIDDP